ncbi:SDR family oxidoreductase [Variovorax sp. YR216]|uniref:SDR family oxidoreductase n=1 Tax=Variovorax sp. YR216 TaxID=1882828 RepID=UPI000899F363|nr:SDR family oxidoreductase [Variovorax sp. YR216]SEA45160.1 Short-chain dehydrogenase [Variovorax sp. YR216]
MQIKDSVVFITGANRGLGLAFARAALAAGAKKVYAAARDPKSVTLPGVVPIALDVTRPEQAEAAARECGDVTLLVNNAGISRGVSLFGADGAFDDTRAEFETNFFGPWALSRAFAPVLAANGGGAIINVLSILSWLTLPSAAGYSASKSAAWSLSNALRAALRGQGTKVLSLHVAFMDTDMTSRIPGPKASPDDVVTKTFEALEAGKFEVLADPLTQQVKAGLSAELPPYAVERAG